MTPRIPRCDVTIARSSIVRIPLLCLLLVLLDRRCFGPSRSSRVEPWPPAISCRILRETPLEESSPGAWRVSRVRRLPAPTRASSSSPRIRVPGRWRRLEWRRSRGRTGPFGGRRWWWRVSHGVLRFRWFPSPRPPVPCPDALLAPPQRVIGQRVPPPRMSWCRGVGGPGV
jgi:hypothetical protein